MCRRKCLANDDLLLHKEPVQIKYVQWGAGLRSSILLRPVATACFVPHVQTRTECPAVNRNWMSPWAKCWSNTGWRSRSRGTAWVDEANVAQSIDCGQVDRVVDSHGDGYVAPAGGYHTQIWLMAEILCQNAAFKDLSTSVLVFLKPKWHPMYWSMLLRLQIIRTFQDLEHIYSKLRLDLKVKLSCSFNKLGWFLEFFHLNIEIDYSIEKSSNLYQEY